MAAQPQSAGVKEGVPVPLKLAFKLGVGAVRQSILARIIWCCVCICVMHVFVSLLELSGGIVCLSCHTAIGHRPRTLQVHRSSLRLVQFSATDVTSNPTPQGLLRRRTRRPQSLRLWGRGTTRHATAFHWPSGARAEGRGVN